MKALARDDSRWAEGQRALAKAMADWRARPDVAPVFAALDKFGRDEPLEACGPLAGLFEDGAGPARGFVDALVSQGLAGLTAHPLGQLPLRHAHRDAVDTLLLAHAGNATLGLAVYDGEALEALPEPTTADFAPILSCVRILSGSGQAVLFHQAAGGAELRREERILEPGTVIVRHGARQALQVRSVQGSLVVLRLQKLLSIGEPVVERDLAGDGPVREAAATAEFSRLEIAMAILAALGRRDAVPALSRIVDGRAPPALRWQALRAILALDVRAGLVLLGTVAASGDAALGEPARALHRLLVRQWPELEKVAQWRG